MTEPIFSSSELSDIYFGRLSPAFDPFDWMTCAMQRAAAMKKTFDEIRIVGLSDGSEIPVSIGRLIGVQPGLVFFFGEGQLRDLFPLSNYTCIPEIDERYVLGLFFQGFLGSMHHQSLVGYMRGAERSPREPYLNGLPGYFGFERGRGAAHSDLFGIPEGLWQSLQTFLGRYRAPRSHMRGHALQE